MESTPDGDGENVGDATLMNASYSRLYGEVYRTHWWWRAREANVLHFVRRFLDAPSRRAKILDVGCGDGFIWKELEKFGVVEGVEPDPLLIAPDSPWRSRIEVADFLTGQPRGSDHDLILMLDVLEHIQHERKALERVVSLLGERGCFVMTVPALPALWSEFDVLTGHYRRYTKKTLRKALEGAGLRVLELRYCYTWTVLPLFLRKIFFKADGADDSHFVKAPPAPLSGLLTLFSKAEHLLTRKVAAPVGSSLLAIAVPAAAGRSDPAAVRASRPLSGSR
ncbi:class I SAM-dependent methyltransferase [Streptomyces clavifer]|uniref:class I SAM-dependent methyltransferase n=1 Tax=Streptomyces clavifer TaxID=68188 RepID=UPI0036ADA788